MPSKYERRVASNFYRMPRAVNSDMWYYPDKGGIEFFGTVSYRPTLSWRALETLMKHRAIARRLNGGKP